MARSKKEQEKLCKDVSKISLKYGKEMASKYAETTKDSHQSWVSFKKDH